MLYTLLFICAQFINPLKNRLKQIAPYNLNFDASIQKYVFDGLAIFCLTSAFGEKEPLFHHEAESYRKKSFSRNRSI